MNLQLCLPNWTKWSALHRSNSLKDKLSAFKRENTVFNKSIRKGEYVKYKKIHVHSLHAKLHIPKKTYTSNSLLEFQQYKEPSNWVHMVKGRKWEEK